MPVSGSRIGELMTFGQLTSCSKVFFFSSLFGASAKFWWPKHFKVQHLAGHLLLPRLLI